MASEQFKHHCVEWAVSNPSQTAKNRALLDSISTSCLQCVNTVLTSGADVNMTEKYSGRTPLMEAVINNDTQCTDKLLEMGADVSKLDCKQKTALIYTVEGRICSVSIDKKLIEAGADVNFKDATGRTALMYSVDNESVKCEVVNALLKKVIGAYNEGADVNKEEAGVNREGTDVNSQDDNGETSLILAATRGHHEVVKALIQAGADVNLFNSMGETALICAAKSDYDKCVDALIKAGADVNVRQHFYCKYYNSVLQVLQSEMSFARYLSHNCGCNWFQY